jgi:hypothetical protein
MFSITITVVLAESWSPLYKTNEPEITQFPMSEANIKDSKENVGKHGNRSVTRILIEG